ncbi:penicillin-binding protein 2 [Geobacter sp. OR-1]|uniref:penicillin-binding protein n=1 Tax=Geobacter sp. OR-1 TaxID=1266765 RepID=UPI0005420AC8|nr:penicillin-binding protein 2 [Geobacter sp. OR-1]
MGQGKNPPYRSPFCFLLLATSSRAFYLQVIKREQLEKLAERQHQKTVQLTPARGTIFDANNASLAVSIEMESCFAEPRNIEDPRGTAAKLAPLLGLPQPQLQQKLTGSKGFVWIQRQLAPELVARIKELELDGVGFVKESKRFYPNLEMAASVIGFTGLDPEGLEGIERKYNSTILGSTGYMITERDALGRDVALKNAVVQGGSKGHNVTLTLDKNIQYMAEKELAKAVAESQAKAGTALVMEPHSGRILAMANYPGFNPNVHQKYSPSALRNRAIADSFEPGSTFKVFLLAAAIEEGIVNPRDTFDCEMGSYEIGGRTIHDTHKYARISVADILKYSSNIGAAKIGSRLGSERLYRYLKSFGFGERNGIDLPAETSGNLRDRNQWFAVDLANISFGQGVAASALQIASAVSAVANGGVLMKPYLVEKITDADGNVLKQVTPQSRNRVISPGTARTIATMMESVTGEGGTGTNAAVDGYRVAGKTGTAQKVDPVTRGYSVDKRTASFVGFVPADNPKLTILIVIDEPKTSPYGGVVAAPAFGAIAQQALCYLKITPDAKLKKSRGTEPEIARKSTIPAAVAANDNAAEGEIVDSGQGLLMPDFRGKSMRDVMRGMQKRSLNVRLIGSGRAVEQSPLPGQRIGPRDQVWVKFTPSA